MTTWSLRALSLIVPSSSHSFARVECAMLVVKVHAELMITHCHAKLPHDHMPHVLSPCAQEPIPSSVLRLHCTKLIYSITHSALQKNGLAGRTFRKPQSSWRPPDISVCMVSQYRHSMSFHMVPHDSPAFMLCPHVSARLIQTALFAAFAHVCVDSCQIAQ